MCADVRRGGLLARETVGVQASTSPRTPDQPDTAVWLQTEATGGARYRSGLTVYDEVLDEGRFIGRYWSATGTIVPARHIEEEREIRSRLPAEAFRLKIDDHVLDRNRQWVAAREEPETTSGTRRVVVELAQQAHPLRVKVHTHLSAGQFLVRRLEITNTAGHPVALTSVAPFSGLLWWTRWYQECIPAESAAFTLGYYKGDQPKEEGNFIWEPLQLGAKVMESRIGRSGHRRPSFMIRNEENGETFIPALAWSSNRRFEVTVEQPTHAEGICLSVAIGPGGSDPVLRVIDPGETIRTPEVHIGHLHADLAGCVQALHRHIRNSVIPPQLSGRAHLVAANLRGYLIDREDEARIIREIDIAAAMGAEVFVVDAGWYGPEPNRWSRNVGDRQAGAWLPNDLYPLITHAHDRGLLFGLWVEVESIGINSALRRDHPEWVLTRDDVREVGVGRLDLGTLRYFHITEITDWMPAPRSLKILNGIALSLPPELCLRTFGTEIQNHHLFGDIDFQLRSCLFGQPILRGIAPTLEEIGEPRRSKIIHALDLYKRWIRPILPTALVFHHTPNLPLMESQPWCVLEYASPDGVREAAGIFRLTGPCTGRYTYRPRGLREGAQYRVTWDTTGDAVELSGFELRRDGIEIDLESPLTSELLLIERV